MFKVLCLIWVRWNSMILSRKTKLTFWLYGIPPSIIWVIIWHSPNWSNMSSRDFIRSGIIPPKILHCNGPIFREIIFQVSAYWLLSVNPPQAKGITNFRTNPSHIVCYLNPIISPQVFVYLQFWKGTYSVSVEKNNLQYIINFAIKIIVLDCLSHSILLFVCHLSICIYIYLHPIAIISQYTHKIVGLISISCRFWCFPNRFLWVLKNYPTHRPHDYHHNSLPTARAFTQVIALHVWNDGIPSAGTRAWKVP